MVEARVASASKVVHVRHRLPTESVWVLRASVPLQVKKQFPVGKQEAAPAVRDRQPILRFFGSAPTSGSADPVVQPLAFTGPSRDGQTHEKTVGLKIVD
jgi:hypothetical protein